MTLSNVVHLPTAQEAEEAKITSRALSKYAHNERLHLKIASNNNESEDLMLPGYAINLLLTMLTEMSKGNAITVMPIHAELSTQETAELLNVSRPHLVYLLEQGKIPFRKVGTHRRVLAKDVFEYKQRIDEARLKALDDLAAQAQELGMGDAKGGDIDLYIEPQTQKIADLIIAKLHFLKDLHKKIGEQKID
ncbi:helix-turn-helix domain-containing protein, partial [Methylobacter psychrophilus]|uniref:helix-turn-helix domain-containing protein n=1 Tax=Methylobacter psychrophilus TaxID=96941 RepID=UPI0021D49748